MQTAEWLLSRARAGVRPGKPSEAYCTTMAFTLTVFLLEILLRDQILHAPTTKKRMLGNDFMLISLI